MPDKILALPIISGLSLQIGELAPNWTAYVGVIAIVGTAFFLIADRLGMLKKFNGNSGVNFDEDLKNSLDSLTKEVTELKTVISTHSSVLGLYTEEVKDATEQVIITRNWIKVQEEVRKRLEDAS